MKKLISLALAGGMVLSLAACGSSASTAASTATESTSTAESTAESTASEGKQLKIAFFMYENSNTFTTYIRKIVPYVYKTVPFEQINEALGLLRDGKTKGRVVLLFPED